ncbi:uncharacterized protein CHSO_2482 [Chryseobacterium sp. StRB126]|nr:uncharacterized protein CHSO_2482 [Chryseobacterium sp. StRB126]
MVLGQASIGGGATNDIQKIFPATPETYSMFKAGDFPVDYRTGKLNVSVPLYEIKTRYGVTIPIGLTYNTGGIKVDEMSGIAGLGWSLAIPNTISVEMHGKNDLDSNVWFPKAPYYYTTQEVALFPQEDIDKLSHVMNGNLDTEPDIYHYNLPTISGSFIRDSNGNFRTIPYEDVKISYANDEFTVIDPKGIVYTLGWGNMNKSVSYNVISSEVYFSSFVLKKIKFPNNEEVSFTYGKSMSYSHMTHSFSDIYVDPSNTIACPGTAKKINNKTKNTYTEALLTEVSHDGEKVNLNYTNTIQGIQGRKDLDGTVNTFALSGLTATYQGKEVKKMTLEHDYFVSSGTEDSYKKYRLKLNKIKNMLDNTEHSFEYNEAYLPYLSSTSQDLWGYCNGYYGIPIDGNNSQKLIPNLKYVNKDYTEGGNRDVNDNASQAYILKKIVYPTKGSSSFTYENNTIWETLLISREESFALGKASGRVETYGDGVDAESPEFYMNDASNPSYHVAWTNGCDNASGQIGTTDAHGWFEEYNPVTGWQTVKLFAKTIAPFIVTPSMHNKDYKKRVRVNVISGNSPCAASINAYVTKTVTSEPKSNVLVGGLRIKAIDDFDGQTNYTKRTFDYSKPDDPDHQTSGRLASPLEFLKRHYSVGHPSGVYVDDICENYVLTADQAASSGLSGKDVVAYSYVTENTLGKGKKVYQFPSHDFHLNITQVNAGWNPYLFLDKNLQSEKSYSVTGELLQEKKYEYELNQMKNALSTDQPQGVGNALALSTSFSFYELNNNTMQRQVKVRVNNSYNIQSGKWLLTKSTDKNYLNGILTSETVNSYSLSDINKPINLMKSETRFFDGSASEISYQYAHEKNNQKLINANIIATPLESSSIQKRNVSDPSGTTISKTETKYDDPANLLPTSVLSFDLQNSQAATTEVTYDKYDAKGNLQQYTTKEGIPTVIIWGYESILPIAKIVGAKLSDINQSFIDSIVIASQTDGSQGTIASEERMLNALDRV